MIKNIINTYTATKLSYTFLFCKCGAIQSKSTSMQAVTFLLSFQFVVISNAYSGLKSL